MCGFVGVIGADKAAALLYLALQAMQHRGQDAAGIGTFDDHRFHLWKDLGMVAQALPSHVVANMPGRSGIGHVRYPTLGGSEREDAQPFMTRRPGILAAHNGNITNMPELEAALQDRGLLVMSRCDSEPIMLVLADELTRIRPAHHTTDDLCEALLHLMKRVKGSYTVSALLEIDGRETLVGIRDPHGIRPGVYGRRKDGAWMIASESVALDVLGFERVGFVPTGGAILLREGEEPVIREILPLQPRHCVFERIYFARADSVMEGGRVNTVRWALGERLADEFTARGLTGDAVIAVPDTSRPAAMAMAARLGVPNREGFIKNRYTGRTFIMPDEGTREATLRLKLNPIKEEFAGKRVILMDDSIVRGATMRRIIAMVRECEPTEVHLAIFSPPVRYPCYYGIDMPSREELIATRFSPDRLVDELVAYFGVDSITYLSQEGLQEVTGGNLCAACFDGDYVVPVSESERGYILAERRAC